MPDHTAWKFNFTGWVLFTVSAVLFLWTTWQAADMIGILASVAFLVACIVFMVPAWRNRPNKNQQINDQQ